MKIKYFGHACFLVDTGKSSICIDPYGDIGLTEPNICADYYFCSHEHYDHNNYKIVKGAKPLDSKINYQILQTYHDKQKGKLRGINKVLVLNQEFKVVHLGDLGEIPSQEVLQKIKNADILFCPIGGTYTIDYLEAIELINLVKPKIVIPMHYKINGSTVDVDTEQNFINNIGLVINYKDCEIDINSKDLTEKTKIFLLEVAK